MIIEYFLDWVRSATVEKRVESAGALVRLYLRHDISDEESDDVEAAITTLLNDGSARVRRQLALSFGAYPSAPQHIVSSLANDSLEISTIVLSQSPVFHDAELAAIVREGNEKQQVAIACRPWLSEKLVETLISSSGREACYAMLLNPAANLSKSKLHELAGKFGQDTQIRNVLLEQFDLYAETRLLLMEELGSQLTLMMENNRWVSEDRAEKAVADACERASITFAAKSSDEDVCRIVRARIVEGKLTTAYLLRAVCMGNITLFAWALSELSKIRYARVEAVLTKDRRHAFRAIYDRAGLPKEAFSIFQIAISTWRELLASKSETNQSRLPFLVTQAVLSGYHEHSKITDDLLILLRKFSAEAARDCVNVKAIEIASRGQVAEAVELEPAQE
ncbi:MAG: DUF2336 domain-containing protein, partial [Pseudomonadota bacterium]